MLTDEFFDLYYDGNRPENVRIYFLKEVEYVNTYKRLAKQFYQRIDSDYKGTCGYCIKENNKDVYHVLIKDYGDGFENVHVLNLFHELSHIETMPLKVGAKLLCSSGKNKEDALIGLDFWREYIAQYEAVNQYQMKYDDINFLYDCNSTQRVLERLKKSYETNLYEIVLYSEITNIFLDGTKEVIEDLIRVLIDTKSEFKSREEIRGISEKKLQKIGKKVKEVLKVFEKGKN